MTRMHLHHRPVDIDFDGDDMVGMCACVCVFIQRIYQVYVKQKMRFMINCDKYRYL